MHKESVSGLLTSVNSYAQEHGASSASELEKNAALLLEWAKFLLQNKLTGVANELLYALHSSIRETAACLALGLIRPTLFSLRGQIDLVLSWIYFKDHAQEYALLLRTGENFKLKSEILKYIELHYEHFNHRFKLLIDIRERQEADPYRILSAHIHAQQDTAVPRIENLSDIVNPDLKKDCLKLQSETAEFLSDILFSISAPNYATLPETINKNVTKRCQSAAQCASLYGGPTPKT